MILNCNGFFGSEDIATTTDLDWAAAPDEYRESRGLLILDWPERDVPEMDDPEWDDVHDFDTPDDPYWAALMTTEVPF